MIELSAYPEWLEIKEQLPKSGITAIVGAPDTGKTTFCELLANHAIENGCTTAIIDSDIGQSEIGPPTVIGMTILDAPLENWSEVKLKGMAFVGSITPAFRPNNVIVGVKTLTDSAINQGAESVIIDTSGYVFGGPALQLKLTKLICAGVKTVIALQRDNELNAMISALSACDRWKLITLPVPASVGKKLPALRIQRRRTKFHLYLENSSEHIVSFNKVAFVNSRLGAGEPMPAEEIAKLCSITECNILCAERYSGGMNIVTQQQLPDSAYPIIQNDFSVRQIYLIDPRNIINLCVGLIDFTGKTYAMGYIEAIDFNARRVKICAPVRSTEPLRWLELGLIKIDKFGRELGEIRPWQV